MTDATGAELLNSLLTPTDRLSVEEGELVVDGHKASELLAEFGSPLFVLSAGVFVDNLRRIRSAFSANWPEPVSVLYAIKTNNNLAVRALMSANGAGGDAFSEGELDATIRTGTDMSKVVINGSDKSDGVIRTAVRHGACINFDCAEDAERTSAIAAAEGVRARVLVRLRLTLDDADAGSEDYPAVEKLRNYLVRDQVGLSAESAAEIVPRVLKDPNLELIGYHFHQGRQSRELAHFQWWAKSLGRTVGRLADLTGFQPQVIDTGGGYPRQRDTEMLVGERMNPLTIEEYGAGICEGLIAGLTEGGVPIPELWIEPGRFISGNSGVLLATVGTVKSDQGSTWVNVDASINNLPRVDNRSFKYVLLPATRMDEQPTDRVNVVGALCTGAHFASDLAFPPTERGDAVAFLDAGMYAEVGQNQYNAVPRPATVMVLDGEPVVVKRRETLDDVFAAHQVPEGLKNHSLSAR
ncbi:hypothetical protein F9278_41875 [Streptomyces phaeolivaceus]|uniref:Orn/DAP/Arg decarboxylase 2 N-terminal domain-containing protein n=1 Tax=Streptomyces phaeolivaceus TaxID=2653200 RepID=A0A5P8KFT2_9ACTN|nr:hypothetical protein [Streptomyces phaeolivaceus]QFR01653.1 hypothetical protein F9278_41875 [Streptomyces phaeolivaceus]